VAVVRQRQIQHQQGHHQQASLAQEPRVISAPIMETGFEEMIDGSLVEMIEDPENSSRTLFAIFKNGEVRTARQIKSEGRVIRPIPRDEEIVKHVCLPRGVKPYESVVALMCRINEEVLSRCLDLGDNDRFLLACFILSTWFIDCACLPVAPYLALVGLPASGKSTVLKILRLLCRRSLLTADISSAAFYRTCDRLIPTLLIDETATAGTNRALMHQLRIGNSREVVALRKGQSFSAYGAKAVAWNELPNDSALNSRCIVIPMCATNRTDLVRPTDPSVVAAVDDIQRQLLQYRLEKLKSIRLPNVGSDGYLHGRFRDLYESLALPISEVKSYCEWLMDCFKLQQQSNREPLLPDHAAIVGTLYKDIHIGKRSTYKILDLTGAVNATLREAGESRRLTPRGVGAALTSLGIKTRTRTNRGWLVWMNRDLQKHIHDLVALYGLDNESLLPSRQICQMCDLCDPDRDTRNYRFHEY
jgi:hypothetical protein